MKPTTTHHEILLFTGNSFSKRQFCSRDENDNGRKLSPAEELEKACWDGMVNEMFPEFFDSSARSENFIWYIMNGKHFLNINIGSCPPVIENETSVDPYFFLTDNRHN